MILTDKLIRMSKKYELLRFEMLTEKMQFSFQGLETDPEFYGILSPINDKKLGVKSVNKELALLLLSLQTPGKIPNYILKHDEDNYESVIYDLLLANVLEVEIDDHFIGGAALKNYDATTITPKTTENYLSQLSYNAILYGMKLPINDVTSLGARIYFHNRYPLSSEWKKRFEEEKFLEVKDKNSKKLLKKYWTRSKSKIESWEFWQKNDNELDVNKSKSTYKLYISPRPDKVGSILDIIVPVLTEMNVPRFKYGVTVQDVLRPDKIVIYFKSYEEMFKLSETIIPLLQDFDVHGIPFSSQLDERGLISWGIDPPKNENKLQWQERESWRVWVSFRIANAILQARSESLDFETTFAFVLDKMASIGVNVDMWNFVGDKNE